MKNQIFSTRTIVIASLIFLAGVIAILVLSGNNIANLQTVGY